jgi:4-amino-4-deoxy-L-arabinose transferase-like glycosyltransferase
MSVCVPNHEESVQQRTLLIRFHRFWQGLGNSDVAVLLLIALASVLLRTLVNGRYGFHRDELLTYNNARHLAWGYVPYPPITPFLARVELELFGTSLRGFRFFAAVAQSLAMLLAGLAARRLGGKRQAQVLAALAAGLGGPSLVHGSFISYTAFDFPCWILVAYFVICLLKSEDPRWFLAIGGAIGIGLMAKYSMAFFTVGLVGGLLLTPARRYLKSPWLWGGGVLAFLIVLPNAIWQIQHDFVSFAYLKSIHSRDISWGSTNYFLPNQLWKCTNPALIPLWAAGLWYFFATTQGKRYRMIGWMYVVTLLVFLVARARDYYLAPAYPMLIAAGAVWGERWLSSVSPRSAASVRRNTWTTLALASLCSLAITLPIAPINSTWWHIANAANGVFDNQIGWPELVEQVAKIRDSLPAEKRARVGILAGDEGEAGAINLYGPAYGLPPAISGMNENWYRGYGDPPPETVITLGELGDFVDQNFDSCTLAGHVTNRYGIANSSVAKWNDIYVCHHLRWRWPEFWRHFRYYG